MEAFFQNNKQWAKCLTMNHFHWTILGLVGTMSLWLKKLLSRGGRVAIRMSWCAVFEKIISQGDGYLGLESKHLEKANIFIHSSIVA